MHNKPHSEETKQKIREALKNAPPHGHHVPHTLEARQKMSLALKGKKRGPYSLERKLNISNSLKGRRTTLHSGWGKSGVGRPRTLSEKAFAIAHPKFEQQVYFGTGKGGLKTWGCMNFTADFLDRPNKVVYELDGSSHKKKQEVDARKDAFFTSIGIKVFRIPT